MPIFVTTDIHLEKDEGLFLEFLEFLCSKDKPATLLLLGDVFSLWLESSYSIGKYKNLSRITSKLKRSGWKIICIPGNREIIWNSCFRSILSCECHNSFLNLTINNKDFLFSHGDRLCKGNSYRVYSTLMKSFPIFTMILLFPPLLQKAIARTIENNKQAKPKIYRGKLSLLSPKRILETNKNKNQKIIIGHLHNSVKIKTKKTDLQILECWSETQGPYLFIDDNGEITEETFTLNTH